MNLIAAHMGSMFGDFGRIDANSEASQEFSWHDQAEVRTETFPVGIRLAGNRKPRHKDGVLISYGAGEDDPGSSKLTTNHCSYDKCVNGRSANRPGSFGAFSPAVGLAITSVNVLRKAAISSAVPTVIRTCVGHAGQMRPM